MVYHRGIRMRFFIALSYNHRKELKPAIEQVKKTLTTLGDEYVVYTEKQLPPSVMTGKKMMLDSLREIRDSDAMIVECSHKAVGVGIELGYAVSLGKPIIGIRRVASEPSNTIEGTLRRIVEYDQPKSIPAILQPALDSLRQRVPEGELVKPLDPEVTFIIEEAHDEAEEISRRFDFEEIVPQHSVPCRFLLEQLAHEAIVRRFMHESENVVSESREEEGEYERVMSNLRAADARIIEERELSRPLDPTLISRIEIGIAQATRTWRKETQKEISQNGRRR